jgi:acetyl-CoA acetyltransferase
MMIKRRVAVIGAGMTLFRRRLLETGRELSYEASNMALGSAGMTMKDIDSVVIGSGPDAFDGVHMKGEYLLEGSGGIGRANTRVYVGGGHPASSTPALPSPRRRCPRCTRTPRPRSGPSSTTRPTGLSA